MMAIPRSIIFRLAGVILITAPAAARGSDSMLSASLEARPSSVYTHEPFELLLSIRSRGVQLGHEITISGLPDASRLKGLERFEELPMERTQRDGRVTETRHYRARVRAPSAGTLWLAPAVHLTLVQREQSGWGSIQRLTAHRLDIDPVELTVKPLPPAPADVAFSGAVGRFALHVDVTPRELAVGDLLTVRSRITGSGYLETADPPSIDESPAFRRYPPRRVPHEQEAVFDQTLVPLGTNATAVPPVRFTYFDPRRDSFQTVTSDAVPLTFRDETVTEVSTFRPDEAPPPPADDTSVLRHARRGQRVDLPAARTAHAAPGSEALVLFDLPAGSPVRVLERHRDWLRIATGQKRGWIQAGD